MNKQRIGFIGLGAMGSSMAARLVAEGYPVTVWNRTSVKSQQLTELGASAATSPAEAAKEADLLFVSVADDRAVEAVLFGENGALSALPPGAIVADMSTVPPGFARELAARVGATGRRALDACVLGNAQHARDGELRIMVGGATEDLAAIRGVLGSLAKEVTHLGGNGMGATMKLTLNLLMGIEMQALAEAVVLGGSAGLDRQEILRMIAASGFASPVMRFKAGVMARGAFDRPDFRLALMRKDMTLALAEAHRLGVPMPATAAAQMMLTAAASQGLGEQDCASILTFMEQVSGSGAGQRDGSSQAA